MMVNTFFGKYDCTSEQKDYLKDFLEHVEYDYYDILIQLCDAISLPNGACIMEKRLGGRGAAAWSAGLYTGQVEGFYVYEEAL